MFPFDQIVLGFTVKLWAIFPDMKPWPVVIGDDRRQHHG